MEMLMAFIVYGVWTAMVTAVFPTIGLVCIARGVVVLAQGTSDCAAGDAGILVGASLGTLVGLVAGDSLPRSAFKCVRRAIRSAIAAQRRRRDGVATLPRATILRPR